MLAGRAGLTLRPSGALKLRVWGRSASECTLQEPLVADGEGVGESEPEMEPEVDQEGERAAEWTVVGNNSSAKEVRQLVQAGGHAKFEGASYHNLLCLYRALRKQTGLSSSPPHHKTRAELFHFSVKRKIAQRDALNRLQVRIERSNPRSEASLVKVSGSTKATTFPKLPLDIQLSPSLVGLDEQGSGYTSFHFLMTSRSCYQRKVYVKELGKDAELEVGYGVFPPTRKDYLRLYDSFFKQWCLDHRRSIHQKHFPLTLLDVGCGSGVLGFMTLKHLKDCFSNESLRAFLLGVDHSHEAVRCSTLNATNLNVEQNAYFVQSSTELFPVLADEPNTVRKRPLSRHVKALRENQYDFIICNPPWLPTDLDGGEGAREGGKEEIGSFSDSFAFDQAQDSFLERFITQAAPRLRPEGRIFMIHSNLGHLLGLYEEDLIPRLCSENQLRVLSIYETDARVKFSEKDWFAEEKSRSKVLLYEIVHAQTTVPAVREAPELLASKE
jgi:methylase of polypeptide subunit release factors